MMKRKQFIIIGLLLLLVGGVYNMAFAAWLDNVPVTVVQPNGDTLHLFATGDEFYHYLHDTEGYTVVQHPETGYYVYAEKVNDRLIASNYVYGTINPSENGIQPRLTISNEEYSQRRREWGRYMPQNRTETTNHGTLNNLVIFVRFSDQPEFTQSYSSINNMFNDESQGAVSMVRYFDQASWGDIHISSHLYPSPNGNTIISYTFPHPRNYFKKWSQDNPIGYINTIEGAHERAMKLLKGAIHDIKNLVSGNLDIDYDTNGYVDNVVFVINGNVEGSDEFLLWPMKWDTWGEENDSLVINGKYVFDFNFQFAGAGNQFHVGVLCHEMNHVLGALDTYHANNGDYHGLIPVWSWDLQSVEGPIPQQHTAYMKMKYDKWISEIPDITDTPGTYTLNALAGPTRENVAYKIRSSDPNQFYVLEYRNNDLLFDCLVPGKGLIIYRVDTRYNGNLDYNPTKNIYDEMYVFRPGGSPSNYNGVFEIITLDNGSQTVMSDISYFSAQSGRTSFNFNTDPYPFLTNGTAPDRSISIFDISEAGNTISFTYGYKIEASSNIGQDGTVTGGGLYKYNSLCTLTATPNENCVFSNWTKNGEVVSTEPEITFVVTEDAAYVANFIRLHTIIVEAMPTNGGTVEGGGTYLEGDQCTITATPNPGYIFKGWYFPVGLSPVIPLPTFTYTVMSNLHLIAKFQPATPTTDVYQYYCWFDQDYSTVQTGSFQTTETFFTLDVSTLSEGLHTLHVMLDDNGLSAPKTFLFMKTPVTSPNSTYQYHCWFDQDYGTVQTGTFGGEGFSFALDANALEEGIHTVHVMLEGDDLSASKTYMFLKAPVASSTATYTYHCWFDQDYGTVQTGTFGGEGFSFALDANALEEGIHTVHVMLEGDDLSASKTYMFLKAPVASSTATYTYHCWFDQDYGTVQTGTFGGDGYCFAIDASALDNGLHFLNVMLEGDDLTASKRYLFNKVPIGGEGITRWEYCLNGDWSDATVTDLVPTVSTLDIIAMLPVAPQPIRSQSFEFQINNGQPEVYAKNYITFRFWDAENRFIDRSAEYVDETVHENVVAEWIERNTTRTIVTPGPNQIHWFKLDASLGNLMEFMADHECTIQLFSPSGELAFSSMSVASIVFNGSYAREEGVFYLAVHDVEEGYDNISITYRYTGTTTQTQNVALVQGTNWFSTYLEITKEDLQNALLATLSDPTGTIIKSQDGNSTYRSGRWRDQNFVWDVAKMYMIVLPEDCVITLTGLPIDPADHPITITPNTPTWIGFPFAESKTPAEAIPAGFAVNGDIIKSMGGNARYNNGSWRTQGMNRLEPGQGYIYNSAAVGERTLIFPTSAK